MLCGELPFHPKKPIPILEQVQKGEYKMPEKMETLLSFESRNLIRQLLQKNATERISLDKIMQHPWIQ